MRRRFIPQPGNWDQGSCNGATSHPAATFPGTRRRIRKSPRRLFVATAIVLALIVAVLIAVL